MQAQEQQFSRPEQVLIYVYGAAAELKAKGLLAGGRCQLSDAGLAEFEKLKLSGFKPTDEELRDAAMFLKTEG